MKSLAIARLVVTISCQSNFVVKGINLRFHASILMLLDSTAGTCVLHDLQKAARVSSRAFGSKSPVTREFPKGPLSRIIFNLPSATFLSSCKEVEPFQLTIKWCHTEYNQNLGQMQMMSLYNTSKNLLQMPVMSSITQTRTTRQIQMISSTIQATTICRYKL